MTSCGASAPQVCSPAQLGRDSGDGADLVDASGSIPRQVRRHGGLSGAGRHLRKAHDRHAGDRQLGLQSIVSTDCGRAAPGRDGPCDLPGWTGTLVIYWERPRADFRFTSACGSKTDRNPLTAVGGILMPPTSVLDGSAPPRRRSTRFTGWSIRASSRRVELRRSDALQGLKLSKRISSSSGPQDVSIQWLVESERPREAYRPARLLRR